VLLLGYFVVLVVIALATVPALVSTVRTLDRQQKRYDPAATAVSDLLSGALNQETGMRGYVLTARAPFLAPFNEGTTTFDHALEVLHAAPLGTQVAKQLEETETAFRHWRGSAKRLIAEVRTGHQSTATANVASGAGKKRFDAFRAQQDLLRTTVAQDVAASRRHLRNTVRTALLGLSIALLIGLALALSLWLWWRVWGKRGVEQERELADNAVLLQSVIDATNDPIFAKDSAGRHILANRARVASLTGGRTDVDLIGRTVDEFVDAQLAAQIREGERRVLEHGTEERLEEELPQPGGPRVFLTTKSPLRDAQGRITGVVGVARDITEERELLFARERLYEVEHELATTLQHSMLGNAAVADDRVVVCARYQPAVDELAVGGDWYDVVELDNGTIALIAGDVVGRGIDAATAMGQLRSALAALARSGLDPAGVLEAVERFAATIPKAHFATCVFVVVDPANERITYSSAGHMPPLVVDANGATEFLAEHQDPPLVVQHSGRRTTTRPFGGGSTVFLFTDGLVERRTESIDAGLARLERSIAAHHQLPVDAMCDQVIFDLLADQTRRDDVAVIAARLMSPEGRQVT
jgi:PAS domain S-box-containing protein